VLHIAVHFIVPLLLVARFFRKNYLFAYAVLMATMLVDLDHLLATPIYDPKRCSIGFHPLHTILPIIFYAALSLVPRPLALRLVGIGLLVHMGLDSIDCQLTNGVWFTKGFADLLKI
jgi:hypothetical protein